MKVPVSLTHGSVNCLFPTRPRGLEFSKRWELEVVQSRGTGTPHLAAFGSAAGRPHSSSARGRDKAATSVLGVTRDAADTPRPPHCLPRTGTPPPARPRLRRVGVTRYADHASSRSPPAATRADAHVALTHRPAQAARGAPAPRAPRKRLRAPGGGAAAGTSAPRAPPAARTFGKVGAAGAHARRQAGRKWTRRAAAA